MSDVAMINTADIRVSPIQLRDAQTNSDDYRVLVESIKTKGFLGTIEVNPKTDEATEESYYEVINGCQRLTAAKEAGLDEIPCVIMKNISEFDQMSIQFVMNKNVPTKPAQFGAHMLRMMNTFRDQEGRDMTMQELASHTCQSVQYCTQRLKLNKIESQTILENIDEGKITLSSAIALSKLPQEEQEINAADAMTMPTIEFCTQVENRVQELRKAAREGRSAEEPKFVAKPKLRKAADLSSILDLPRDRVMPIVEASDLSDPVDLFMEGIRFALSMDHESLRVQEATWNQKQTEKKRKAEARKKKQEEEKLAKKQKEVDAMEAGIESEATDAA